MKLEKLTILWTTDNVETSKEMVLRYVLKANAHNWWRECNLITWGPSNRLICENPEIQILLKMIIDAGVNVSASYKCAEELGLVEQLDQLGIEVKLMGEILTHHLQDSETRVLSI